MSNSNFIQTFARSATIIHTGRAIPAFLGFVWDNQAFFAGTPVLSGEAPCWREVYESGAIVSGNARTVAVSVPLELWDAR